MKVAFGSDRKGFAYKNRLMEHLRKAGYEVMDFGTYEEVPSDSPVYAAKVARVVAAGECDRGVLICATGTGMVIAANKIKGCMAGMGYDDEAVRLMREHNDANVICFGQEHMDYADVERRCDIFLNSTFSGLEHQSLRIKQIQDLENGLEICQSPILNSDWK